MTTPRRTTIAHRSLARQRAERNKCPACDRKSAVSTVINPGTVSRVCRWCDWESTTLTDEGDR